MTCEDHFCADCAMAQQCDKTCGYYCVGHLGGGCVDDPGGRLAASGMTCEWLVAEWGSRCEVLLDETYADEVQSAGTSVAALCPASCGACGQGQPQPQPQPQPAGAQANPFADSHILTPAMASIVLGYLAEGGQADVAPNGWGLCYDSRIHDKTSPAVFHANCDACALARRPNHRLSPP
jgi:hypothetical protein